MIQIEPLKHIIATSGDEPIRKLIVTHEILEVPLWAEKILSVFPYNNNPRPDLNGVPCISRAILPFMQEKAYQPQDDEQWAREQIEQIEKWREGLLSTYGKAAFYWIVAAPKELLWPDVSFPSRCSDEVPIQYRIKTVAHLLKPVFEYIAVRHEAVLTYDPYTLHAFCVDCFYHVDTQSSPDLARYFIPLRKRPELHPLEILSEDRYCHHVEVDAYSIEERLKHFAGEKALAADAIFARVFLIKKAVATPNQCQSGMIVTARPRKFLKESDVVFIEVDPENPALFWCKFGSTKQLEYEHSALDIMRSKSMGIREFLYETKSSIISLKSDFISVLVSRHQGSHKNDPEELGEWLKQPRSSGDTRSSGDIRTAYVKSALKEVDRFFNILHVRPIDNRDSPHPKFLETNKWCYDRMLATKRTETFKESNTVPVRNDSNGQYRIIHIRPRDIRGGVQFYLENIQTKNTLLLFWECKDWRWRAWKEGIDESNQVELAAGVRLIPKPRRYGHLLDIDKVWSKHQSLVQLG